VVANLAAAGDEIALTRSAAASEAIAVQRRAAGSVVVGWALFATAVGVVATAS
jgi:hypothetical protein